MDEPEEDRQSCPLNWDPYGSGSIQNPPFDFRLGTRLVDFEKALGTSKVLDARCQGVPIEAYK
jgi:hypothetical protein